MTSKLITITRPFRHPVMFRNVDFVDIPRLIARTVATSALVFSCDKEHFILPVWLRHQIRRSTSLNRFREARIEILSDAASIARFEFDFKVAILLPMSACVYHVETVEPPQFRRDRIGSTALVRFLMSVKSIYYISDGIIPVEWTDDNTGLGPWAIYAFLGRAINLLASVFELKFVRFEFPGHQREKFTMTIIHKAGTARYNVELVDDDTFMARFIRQDNANKQ